MPNHRKELEMLRMQTWVLAWVHTSGGRGPIMPSVATEHADACLADFDKRFPSKDWDKTQDAPDL